jgi:hypothetical protein
MMTLTIGSRYFPEADAIRFCITSAKPANSALSDKDITDITTKFSGQTAWNLPKTPFAMLQESYKADAQWLCMALGGTMSYKVESDKPDGHVVKYVRCNSSEARHFEVLLNGKSSTVVDSCNPTFYDQSHARGIDFTIGPVGSLTINTDDSSSLHSSMGPLDSRLQELLDGIVLKDEVADKQKDAGSAAAAPQTTAAGAVSDVAAGVPSQQNSDFERLMEQLRKQMDLHHHTIRSIFHAD